MLALCAFKASDAIRRAGILAHSQPHRTIILTCVAFRTTRPHLNLHDTYLVEKPGEETQGTQKAAKRAFCHNEKSQQQNENRDLQIEHRAHSPFRDCGDAGCRIHGIPANPRNSGHQSADRAQFREPMLGREEWQQNDKNQQAEKRYQGIPGDLYFAGLHSVHQVLQEAERAKPSARSAPDQQPHQRKMPKNKVRELAYRRIVLNRAYRTGKHRTRACVAIHERHADALAWTHVYLFREKDEEIQIDV